MNASDYIVALKLHMHSFHTSEIEKVSKLYTIYLGAFQFVICLLNHEMSLGSSPPP